MNVLTHNYVHLKEIKPNRDYLHELFISHEMGKPS